MAANYTLSPSPWLQFTLNDGITPAAHGQLFTYVAGTTTPAVTYSSSSGTPNSNPIDVDGAGRAVIFLAPGSYRFDLYESVADGGALIKSQDNISAVGGSSTNNTIDGIAGETVIDGDLCYCSDGSGGKTSGRWYKAKADNAYSSTTPELAFSIGGATIGTTGEFLLSGRLTSGIVVTVGLFYYVDLSTAGAITAVTNITNLRQVGFADSGTSLIVFPNPPNKQAVTVVNNFRLSLTTLTPVTITDVTAATTIYCTPYIGNQITLFDAAGVPRVCSSAEFSIAVPASTSQMYDVFCYNNASVPTLELLAWTNDTTRATALVATTTGVLTKSGDLTRRYIGSFRTTTVSGQTEDSLIKRYLWNYYNRANRPLQKTDSTDSYNYTTATWRQVHADAANQLDVVIGIAEVLAQITAYHFASNTSLSVAVQTGVGRDSTTTPLTGLIGVGDLASITLQNQGKLIAVLQEYTPVGRHFYAWLERSAATGTTTFYGDNGDATLLQTGIYGLIQA